ELALRPCAGCRVRPPAPRCVRRAAAGEVGVRAGRGPSTGGQGGGRGPGLRPLLRAALARGGPSPTSRAGVGSPGPGAVDLQRVPVRGIGRNGGWTTAPARPWAVTCR